MIDGLVVVDKPEGWTSHDVVGKLRKVYAQKRVGHAGTLDPAATGVLLVGLGRVTRLLRFLQESSKAYRGRVAFGIATDTLDAEGAVLERHTMPLDREQVAIMLDRFRGEIDQLPPMVSAVKVGGRKLYEAARRGEEVERQARRVTVHRFELEDFTPGPYPEATVLVECSSGTYVRALAADLGTTLGGCAHLAALRRLRVASFALSEARPIEAIEDDPEAAVVPPLEAMRDLPRVDVGPEQADGVSHGVVFPAPALLTDREVSGPFAVVAPDGSLLAVYEHERGACRPAVVLA